MPATLAERRLAHAQALAHTAQEDFLRPGSQTVNLPINFIPSTAQASLALASLPVTGHAVAGILLTPKHSLPSRHVPLLEWVFWEGNDLRGAECCA